VTYPLGQVAGIRPATKADGAAMRMLIEHDLGVLPYAEIPAYYLRLAFDGRASESRAIVAERGTEFVGLALFGEVAGAVGTGRIHFIAVAAAARRNAIGAGLCETAVEDLRAHGARLVLAEVPAHPALAGGLALLDRCGFAEAARVADYYQDGIDLVLLQRAVASTAA
jgi:ribosomal protein S18 acetylase RimI-like enzyme